MTKQSFSYWRSLKGKLKATAGIHQAIFCRMFSSDFMFSGDILFYLIKAGKE
jgi:hypothetical protein